MYVSVKPGRQRARWYASEQRATVNWY